MGTEGKRLMEIVAFDTDEKSDGNGNAKITWIDKRFLNTRKEFNESIKNYNDVTGSCAGGWYRSDLRSWLRSTVFLLIPDVVKNSIVDVSKYSSIPTQTAW